MPCAAESRKPAARHGSFARLLQLVATRNSPGRDAAMVLLACRLRQGLDDAARQQKLSALMPPRGAPASSHSG